MKTRVFTILERLCRKYGIRLCGELHDGTRECTLPQGHTGPHEAWATADGAGDTDEQCDTWPKTRARTR
jgi:hypothetical protein